jgi:hypothetical protein
MTVGRHCQSHSPQIQMSSSRSVALFASRPLSSAVLALLLVLLGLVIVSGLVPASPNRKYFPGHDWLLASVCWAVAAFFGYCAAKGRHLKRRKTMK